MSVDTYLKGKQIGTRYGHFTSGDVEILIANTLLNWAEGVSLDVKRFLLWQRFKPRVQHKHRPT